MTYIHDYECNSNTSFIISNHSDLSLSASSDSAGLTRHSCFTRWICNCTNSFTQVVKDISIAIYSGERYEHISILSYLILCLFNAPSSPVQSTSVLSMLAFILLQSLRQRFSQILLVAKNGTFCMQANHLALSF